MPRNRQVLRRFARVGRGGICFSLLWEGQSDSITVLLLLL